MAIGEPESFDALAFSARTMLKSAAVRRNAAGAPGRGGGAWLLA
jgi:hypothetical protein